jgi:hypothetical protein
MQLYAVKFNLKALNEEIFYKYKILNCRIFHEIIE